MNAMNVAPLGVVDVAYYSNHAAQYLQNLLKTVEKLPFLQEVIDDLAADPAVDWNCQTGGALGMTIFTPSSWKSPPSTMTASM